jgi:hypothetical protein
MNEIFSYENLLINLIQSLIGVFISIALIQSSIDKLIDRKGNLEWLSNHFSDTILRNFVPLVLLIITITELFSGLLLLSGAFINILFSNFYLLIIGLFLSAINFILLFFGQRIAKDYAGAAVIVNYFILNILGLISILFSFFK